MNWKLNPISSLTLLIGVCCANIFLTLTHQKEWSWFVLIDILGSWVVAYFLFVGWMALEKKFGKA